MTTAEAAVAAARSSKSPRQPIQSISRSAGAVAVGPVIQGLRRPVNDLSRGATVKDIINTVAITAIQAAG